MYPVPKHLRSILNLEEPLDGDDNSECRGRLVCTCGMDEFILLHVGGVGGKGKFQFAKVTVINGEAFLVIKVRCTGCDAEHLVFDDDFHGWNGYVCAADEGLRSRPRPDLLPWECAMCSCSAHRVSVRIVGEDKDFVLSEGEGVVTDADWHEAFGWLTIDIECVTCDFKLGGWVDYETM